MIRRRIWPVLLLAFCCLPLFRGLGNRDLRGDEAGHSFSVDRILETGDWLIPKSSPYPDAPFLEKPPLKFWIVAAGIKAGLPHDEFGLRFWDAVFGSLAFLYVFGIGRKLGGALCGALAVLILFVHGPLLAEHGIRGNNMEAALVLCYCGGIYHFLRWAASDESPRAGRAHAIGVGLYFTLGFMVKFVAAAFLPMVLGVACLAIRDYRTRLLRDWRTWGGSIAISLALIAPWFVYCTVVFGRTFWSVIFGTHVYTRLTSFLDPAHIHPWHFYFTELWRNLQSSNTAWLVAAGSVLLVADSVRTRKAAGALVVLWFAVPMAIISIGTSKLYHYAYPFLPPVALAGGYVATIVETVVGPWLTRVVDGATRARERGGFFGARHPAVKGLCLLIGGLSVVVMVWTVVEGHVTIRYGSGTIFKNSSLVRPALVGAIATLVGGWPEAIATFGVPVLVAAIAPIEPYRATVADFGRGRPVIRMARDCALQISERADVNVHGPRGLYVDGPGSPDSYELPFNHEFAYYFRKIRPWTRPDAAPPAVLAGYFFDPDQQRPLLMSGARYQAVVAGLAPRDPSSPGLPALIDLGVEDAVLVLPGPYGVCGQPRDVR